jgi:hypothetical protein
MIGQILKKKYEEWISSSETKDPVEFIKLAAEDHNSSPEQISEILKLHDWFKVE